MTDDGWSLGTPTIDEDARIQFNVHDLDWNARGKRNHSAGMSLASDVDFESPLTIIVGSAKYGSMETSNQEQNTGFQYPGTCFSAEGQRDERDAGFIYPGSLAILKRQWNQADWCSCSNTGLHWKNHTKFLESKRLNLSASLPIRCWRNADLCSSMLKMMQTPIPWQKPKHIHILTVVLPHGRIHKQ